MENNVIKLERVPEVGHIWVGGKLICAGRIVWKRINNRDRQGKQAWVAFGEPSYISITYFTKLYRGNFQSSYQYLFRKKQSLHFTNKVVYKIRLEKSEMDRVM